MNTSVRLFRDILLDDGGGVPLSNHSLSDLIALHTNYWTVNHLQPGARFEIIAKAEFERIEEEIKNRVRDINYSK